jgi:hypothetical protein
MSFIKASRNKYGFDRLLKQDVLSSRQATRYFAEFLCQGPNDGVDEKREYGLACPDVAAKDSSSPPPRRLPSSRRAP